MNRAGQQAFPPLDAAVLPDPKAGLAAGPVVLEVSLRDGRPDVAAALAAGWMVVAPRLADRHRFPPARYWMKRDSWMTVL